MADYLRDLSSTVKEDTLGLLLGDKIGSGIAREVYEYAPDPLRFVVKIETKAMSFQNVAEYDVWKRVRGTKLERWFAPVARISARGIALIMRRTTPVSSVQDMPRRVPAMLCDFKLQNFGMLNGQVVAHDYGMFNMVELDCLPGKLVGVQWWSAES